MFCKCCGDESGKQVVAKIERHKKRLEKIVKQRSKSRNYQGWCAESIQLQALNDLKTTSTMDCENNG